jgi:hypothetical protein
VGRFGLVGNRGKSPTRGHAIDRRDDLAGDAEGYNMSGDGLRKRFESFIKTMRGFEGIDELLHGVGHDGRKRGDYLLWDRQIIVEQKVLVIDPADKPQKFVDHLIAGGRPIYGRTSTKVIFDKAPDGKELEREMFLSITKGLEDSVANADKQARDTRAIFSIPDAVGILVILNEGAHTLRPDLIDYGLRHVFQKKTRNGTLRYPHNDGVVVISEAHALVSPEGRGMPCFAAITPQGRAREVVAFSDALIYAWAAFNNLPILRAG